METNGKSRLSGLVVLLAILLGLLTAAFDQVAPFDDDTAQATIVLLLACGGLLGFLQPRMPWRWGILVGLWIPAAHVFFYLWAWGHAINPPANYWMQHLQRNTIPANLFRLVVSVAIATLASYGFAILRKTIRQAKTS